MIIQNIIYTKSPMSISNAGNPIIENKNNNNDYYLSRLEKLAEFNKKEFNILKIGIIKKVGSPSIETTNFYTIVTNSESIGTTKDFAK